MVTDDRFEADHRPGCMQLSASLMPCLIVPPEHRPRWAPSPYSYGLHLLGDVPLPEGDLKTLRRGKLMEPVGKVLLREDHGIDLHREQERREYVDLPAVTYLDGLVDRGQPLVAGASAEWAIEFKSMPERVYREHWADGPPLWVRIQCQAQQMISDGFLAGCLIVPIVIRYAGNPDVPTIYQEPHNEKIGQMLMETGRLFLDMLRARELPPPDETVASYDALMKSLKIEPEATVVLADDEAAQQFLWWQQAKHQRNGGEQIKNAAKRWFAARAGNAAVIELPGIGRIERKQVKVSADKEPRPARTDVRWTLREIAE